MSFHSHCNTPTFLHLGNPYFNGKVSFLIESPRLLQLLNRTGKRWIRLPVLNPASFDKQNQKALNLIIAAQYTPEHQFLLHSTLKS